jgi:3-dehydroquinate dehydratase-2
LNISPTVWVLNGPNLNLLGEREPDTYGHDTLDSIERKCVSIADSLGLKIEFKQSNHEGELVAWIQESRKLVDGLAINAGAYTHTSVALHDALKLLSIPIVEVHLSNIYTREQFRHHSFISPLAKGIICGFGANSYVLAIQALHSIMKLK